MICDALKAMTGYKSDYLVSVSLEMTPKLLIKLQRLMFDYLLKFIVIE